MLYCIHYVREEHLDLEAKENDRHDEATAVAGDAETKARELLGSHFFGREEWQKYRPEIYREVPFSEMDNSPFPWDATILNGPCPFVQGKTLRETHFAFLGIPQTFSERMTMLKWRRHIPYLFQPFAVDWAQQEPFFNQQTCGPRWYLMPLGVVSNYAGKTYGEQEACLPPGYEVPLVVEAVTQFVLYRTIHHHFPETPPLWGWCRDTLSSDADMRIGIQAQETDTIRIEHLRSSNRWEKVGIIASRQPLV